MQSCLFNTNRKTSAAIIPTLETAEIDTAPTASRLACWRQLEENWNRIQVGRQGSYSVERLMSLEQYCNTTSWTRVILVCVLTPIPALLVAVLLECLPLRPPSEGWAANWVFWLRLSLTHAMLSFGGSVLLTTFVPDLSFTFWKQIIVTLGVVVGLVGTCILAAHIIGFPVPLMMQFGAIPGGIFTPIMLRLVLGSGVFASGSPVKIHLKRYHRYFLAFMTLIGIYPLFKVLYDFIPVGYRGGVVLVLPIWRFAAKHFIVHATRDLEDIVPESVAFLVDFFSSLFVSVCMSSSGPFYLSFLFIASDLVQIVLEIRELSDNANVLLQLIRQQQADSTTKDSCTTKLLTTILVMIKESGAFQTKSLESVRLWACLPQSLTSKQTEHLLNLEASGAYCRRYQVSSDNIERTPHQAMTRNQNGSKRSVSIVPKLTHVRVSSSSKPPQKSSSQTAHTKGSNLVFTNHSEKSTKLVLQGLQLLFHCEYLELVEYVECTTPIVYVVYKSILEQLPNVVYYPGGAGSWGIATVVNILVLAMLEVTSLVFLHHFLQRKFGFSAMHQLAFVLETDFYLVQMNLFAGILFLIPFELEHFGADFSLR
ncbi:hypothetical protein PC112_g23288, partial [Phytophthora cactorum]